MHCEGEPAGRGFQLSSSLTSLCPVTSACYVFSKGTLPSGSGAQLPHVLLKQNKQKHQKYTLKKRQSLTMLMGHLGGGREGRGIEERGGFSEARRAEAAAGAATPLGPERQDGATTALLI